MGIIDIFKTKFGKKIYVNEEELIDKFCVSIRLKKKRIKINTVINVPDNACVISCYKGKPCDLLPSGEISLNAGSLPILFKRSDYQGDIKRSGKVSNYFEVEMYALSMNLHRLEFDVGKFVVKDKCYGKQKVNLILAVDVKVLDAMKFFKVLTHEHPNLRKKNVKNIICDWVSYDTVNLLKKHKFNIDDYMIYTNDINNRVATEIIKRFGAVGLEIKNLVIQDVVLPDALVREIESNREMCFEIHSKISDYEAVMREDGYESQVSFVRNADQIQSSVFENNYHIQVEDNNCARGMVVNRQSYFSGNGVYSVGKVCNECGREVPSEANYCPYCASKILGDVNTCDSCGANNILDADYCYNCGKKL